MEVITHGISSSTMSINWQGRSTAPFFPSRGIRQGDPISPYLFVIAMERLGHYIMDSLHQGRWSTFSCNRGRPKLSHLFFADDILLIGEASVEQVVEIKHVLDLFCSASGQKISYPKSSVYFSKNVPEYKAKELSDLLAYNPLLTLGNILGCLWCMIGKSLRLMLLWWIMLRRSSLVGKRNPYLWRVASLWLSLLCLVSPVM